MEHVGKCTKSSLLLVLPALFLLRFYFVEIGFVKVDGGNLMGFFAAQNGITYRTIQDEMESFYEALDHPILATEPCCMIGKGGWK